jgi:hypothetical protein
VGKVADAGNTTRSAAVYASTRITIRGDDFNLARQQFEVMETPPLSTAILIRHALKSLGLDQYGLVLGNRICFDLRNLAFLIHALSVTLKARLDSP